jgi:hypothetical protein
MNSNSMPAPLRRHLDDQQLAAQTAQVTERLTFADWLERRGNGITDGWILVGLSLEREDETRDVTSFLVPRGDVKAYLEQDVRGFSAGDGQTAVVDDYMGEERQPRGEPSPLNPGARPFVLHRYYHEYAPAAFQLVQAFELYWNAWWDADMLRWIDVDGTVRDVARMRLEDGARALEVDADHLRAFLAVNDAALLRSHAYKRFAPEAISARIEKPYADGSGRFEIVADTFQGGSYEAVGLLDGRDVVLGYVRLKRDPRVPENGYETFVVDRAPDGSLRSASTDPSVASSYYRDTGSDHSLTQVFFRSAVLARYYADPRRYRIDDGHLSCLHLWSIRFERSTDDLLWVYLGDLGGLPYAEQRHWRPFNEIASEAVSAERFAQDFLAQWTARAPEPVYDFLRAIESVNAAATATLGRALFRPLSTSDEHVRTGLRIPLDENPEEADSQLTAMAKMLVESLDTNLLRSLLPQHFDAKNKSSLKLLEAVLQTWGIATDKVEAVMTPFFNVYYLRSTGSAHFRGSGWEDTLERSGLGGLGPRGLVREALRQAADALGALHDIVASRGHAMHTSPATANTSPAASA